MATDTVDENDVEEIADDVWGAAMAEQSAAETSSVLQNSSADQSQVFTAVSYTHLDVYKRQDRLRQDVMLRIATLDGVKPIALRELNEVMTKLLTGNENLKKQSMGGIKVAAEIMNFMGGEKEAELMEGLKSYDEDMAQQIMDEMFVFDKDVYKRQA